MSEIDRVALVIQYPTRRTTRIVPGFRALSEARRVIRAGKASSLSLCPLGTSADRPVWDWTA